MRIIDEPIEDRSIENPRGFMSISVFDEPDPSARLRPSLAADETSAAAALGLRDDRPKPYRMNIRSEGL